MTPDAVLPYRVPPASAASVAAREAMTAAPCLAPVLGATAVQGGEALSAP